MSHLKRCAAAWLLVVVLPAGASAKWTELRSENFVFVGDASEGQIRRVAERLEQFRDALLRVLPGASAQAPVPTVVMVFDGDRSMTPVKPLYRGKPIELNGYFQSGEDVNYIVVNAEFLDLAVLTVFHEYAHFLVSNSQGRVPVWVGEGLAELYQMTEQLDGGKGVLIGRAPAHHLLLLQRNTMMPVKQLLAVDHSASVYNEGSRRSVLYAQSWALVHYLMLGNPARAEQFRKYLSAMRSGTPDERGVCRGVRRRHRGARSRAFQLRPPGHVSRGSPQLFGENRRDDRTARQDTRRQRSRYVSLPTCRRGSNRVDEARVRAAAIQKRAPKVGRASMVLGAIDLRENQVSDALGHLEKAAALAPDDFIVQSTYGRGLVTQMSEARTDIEGAAAVLPRARQVLRRATTISPGSARAASMLAYAELVGGGDVAAAIGALERAVQLDPSREEYRLLLAQAQIREGEYDKATALLGPLMAAGRTAETRGEARRVLTEVGNIRAARAAGAAPPPIRSSLMASLATPPPPVPPGGSTAVPIDEAAVADLRKLAGRAGLVLRPVETGEERVLGTFEAIDCVNGAVVLRVAIDGRVLALQAKQFADVDFISYRSSTPGEVNCGLQKTRDQVYATYRPGGTTAGIDGQAVAIEVLPDDFVPPNNPR